MAQNSPIQSNFRETFKFPPLPTYALEPWDEGCFNFVMMWVSCVCVCVFFFLDMCMCVSPLKQHNSDMEGTCANESNLE